MAGSSTSDPILIEDDDPNFHFLEYDELHLQEALLSSLLPSSSSSSSSSSLPSSSSSSSKILCEICMDTKLTSEMFQNTSVCSHLYCFECISGHVAAKIKENITKVKCPHPQCIGLIGPQVCHSFVPKEVIERWEDSLCASLILASEKVIYCPFKDCSAMLVDDGGESVTSSECPNCNRLFCASCNVVWHSGLDCNEFQSLNKGERDREDLMLMELAKRKQWKRCAKCKIFVEKKSGCLHISCRCGYHFCYKCGKEFSGIHYNC